MDKILVVYGSKYGATKEYASWIAEELGANLISYTKMTASELDRYQLIIFGGGLYRGKMLGVDRFKRCISKLKDKRIITFAVGAAMQQPDTVDRTKKQNGITQYPLFYFRGGMDYPNMTWIDRILITGLKKMIEKKPANEQDELMKDLLGMYGKKVNFVDKKNIRSLIIETKKKTK